MTEDPKHGPRLSGDEYDRRITGAPRGLPPVPTDEQQRGFDRYELDLAIDLKLGVDFPRDRREALWRARRRTRTSPTVTLLAPVLLALGVLGGMLGAALSRRSRRPGWLSSALFAVRGFQARCARSLEKHVYREYARVLSEDEFEKFFPSEDGIRPGLPVGVEEPRERPGH